MSHRNYTKLKNELTNICLLYFKCLLHFHWVPGSRPLILLLLSLNFQANPGSVALTCLNLNLKRTCSFMIHSLCTHSYYKRGRISFLILGIISLSVTISPQNASISQMSLDNLKHPIFAAYVLCVGQFSVTKGKTSQG